MFLDEIENLGDSEAVATVLIEFTFEFIDAGSKTPVCGEYVQHPLDLLLHEDSFFSDLSYENRTP